MRDNNENVGQSGRCERDQRGRPRDGVLTRLCAAARVVGEQVREVLGRDDDTCPPGFNGVMLVA